MKLAEYESTGRTFIVAEIAQAHDGSVGILHSLVDAAAAAGVDAVKFQVHIAEAESSTLEPFRVRFSTVDATRFDYWKRMELSAEQWADLKRRCEAAGVEFLATPFSNAAVDLLESIGVRRYKVGSGDLANPLLLERLARTGKEVILSTGLGALEEIDAAVALMRGRQIAVTVLQCTTKYPTAAEDIGLPWLATLRTRYACPVGLSDHSGTIYPALGAVALGAVVIEAHITFDRRMFGPDAKASLTVDDFAELVRGVRFLEQARGKGPDKATDEGKQELRRMFGKALAVNRDMQAGETLRFEDLESKKPADGGLPVAKIAEVIGRRLRQTKKRWDFLTKDDFA
ncbi:N-acetylneuraminate synthase family protein [Rhodoferax sp.]|uniref:N-acetylneuraminate synthase family protein n=1 Tax=Rhodoferax sp. TaxID=50421 RepID=UPI001EB2590F|nr:N-acetylneuraminate synthase family protein [Rhodoferax sp.]MBT9507333.1 N-acetylneuraminate synthase family protein [Rhodoferax sp.]